MPLQDLGWDERFAAAFAAHAAEGRTAGRVISEHQHLYRVATESGERLALVSGRFRHQASARESYPAVGDWVVLDERPGEERAVIRAVLPRTSRFSRKVAGDETLEQVVAANIDTVFIVSDLDDDFNLNRLQRYAVSVHEGGARPVIVLNKADLCLDVEARVQEARSIAPGIAVVALSCRTGAGLDALASYLRPTDTVALLGSSGVGKSTIVNRLVGQNLQRTQEVREQDGRGRHTTTHRELIRLEGGALLIDTPGMRELQLWDAGERFDETFQDIRVLAEGCFFRDCGHGNEPRCAVKAAVGEGGLSTARLEHYRQLQRERRHLAVMQDQRALLEEKRRVKTAHKAFKRHKKGG